MSLAYNTYIQTHIENLQSALAFIFNSLDHDEIDKILPELPSLAVIKNQIQAHDQSKYSPEEYKAYDNYFYHGGHATKEGKEAFDRAFLHHIHNNPHHWQYWVLIHDWGDDWASTRVTEQQTIAQEIPDNYILEMICDWWSFSWKEALKIITNNGDVTDAVKALYGIFDWYRDHKSSIIMTDKTKEKVEKLLDLIQTTLDNNYIQTGMDFANIKLVNNI